MIYALTAVSPIGVAASCAYGATNLTETLIAARQLYGLWALGFLLAAMSIGPLTSILPWLPLKAHLVKGRRAVGVSAFIFAALHSSCYLIPVILRNWRELYAPGWLWISGLLLGLLGSIDLLVLTCTSRDKAVRSLGPKRWKRWHKSVYFLLLVVLLHALFNGSDFGVNRPPDVKVEADMGMLFTFISLSALWLAMFILRVKNIKWTPQFIQRKQKERSTDA